jgi:pimeloyl-ACP methyl ester carboxylesterase
MTGVLSVADIDRWNPEAVRDVFHAAKLRAGVATTAADGLASLPAFGTWGGAGAEAARDAVGKTRVDLDAHGEEALAVARAADIAADGIQNVKNRLASLRAEAEQLHMEINPVTDTVVPGPGFKGTAADLAPLQAELNEIIAEANTVDEELAQAINMADGKQPIPADAGAPVGKDGLTPTQRASDANQERLREMRPGVQADVDRLQKQFDQLAALAYTSASRDPALWSQINSAADQLRDAKGRLADIDSINQALHNAPETYLTQLTVPDDPKKQLLAAVAVGNPDAAKNVSLTVPGVGSTTRDSLPGMVSEANSLRNEELRQLVAAGKPASASTIVWMGYTPPSNPLNTENAGDLWQTMTDGDAKAAAPNLANYLEQVRTDNPGAHLTVLGHSYGSLTASLALQDLNQEGLRPVNDAVFYGSPGLELYSSAQLGLDHGQAYVMQAPHDPITNLVAPLAPLHGWGENPYAIPGLTELSTEAGFDPGHIWRDGVYGHADYPRMFTDATGHQVLRMSGYNMAAIAAGLPDNEVTAPLLPPILGGGMPGAPAGSR